MRSSCIWSSFSIHPFSIRLLLMRACHSWFGARAGVQPGPVTSHLLGACRQTTVHVGKTSITLPCRACFGIVGGKVTSQPRDTPLKIRAGKAWNCETALLLIMFHFHGWARNTKPAAGCVFLRASTRSGAQGQAATFADTSLIRHSCLAL